MRAERIRKILKLRSIVAKRNKGHKKKARNSAKTKWQNEWTANGPV